MQQLAKTDGLMIMTGWKEKGLKEANGNRMRSVTTKP